MENANFDNLRPRQQQAIELLLTGADLNRVADEVGVSRETIRKWRKDPDFRSALTNARQSCLERATNILSQASVLAAVTLANALRGDKVTSQQIRASQLVLDNAMRFTEAADLVDQVEELRLMVNELVTARGTEDG